MSVYLTLDKMSSNDINLEILDRVSCLESRVKAIQDYIMGEPPPYPFEVK